MIDWTYTNRTTKPRTNGVTMVMDKGLGLHAFEDMLSIAAPYVDFIKLGFGTLALTPEHIAKEKLKLAQQYGVNLYPGGTFFEVAHIEQQIENYLDWLQELGFKWVEISNGVVEYQAEERSSYIKKAKKKNFQVITEIGKKDAGSTTAISFFIEQFQSDVEAGASYVILEGRETGENIGIFNEQGDVDVDYVQNLHHSIDSNKCIWETPKKSQQVTLMKIIGSQVNLGNIAPADALAVEALRHGLRADTIKLWRNLT
jgi:phosphosulfolactate synthase